MICYRSDGLFRGEAYAYTAFETVSDAHDLGFKPVTTPAYSPESNGMAEAFVNTMRRDYVSGADLSDAESGLKQLPGWIDDYNRVAPIGRVRQR